MVQTVNAFGPFGIRELVNAVFRRKVHNVNNPQSAAERVNEGVTDLTSVLAAMTAAYTLIGHLEPSERWAMARMLVAMLAARLQPGARLTSREVDALGPIGLEQLEASLLDRGLEVYAVGIGYRVRRRVIVASPPGEKTPPDAVR